MSKLTLQDYIDLEKLIKAGAGEFEQQTFLLSRYFRLEIDDIKNTDIRLINIMFSDMEKYIEKTKITQEEVSNEIDGIRDKIKKEIKEGEIDDRFEILDL